MEHIQPPAHPSGAVAPKLAKVPHHVAVVMDGNGRWANTRGLPRTDGHREGEATLMDVIAGALEIGVSELSAYAFSTENWKRSPAEVRYILGFSRQILREQRDDLNAWGVRVRWVGREGRLWKSVLSELRAAEELTKDNRKLTFNLCINYGGKAEIADAMARIAADVADGLLKPSSVNDQLIQRYLYAPDMADVDLFIRTGESNAPAISSCGNLPMPKCTSQICCGQILTGWRCGEPVANSRGATAGTAVRLIA